MNIFETVCHQPWPKLRSRLPLAITAIAIMLVLPCMASAQLAGWSTATPVTVTENSGNAFTGYQLRLVLDTAAMISNGVLNADGSDLRFGSDAQGSTLFDYWIESGIATASTVVWVKLPTLPASASVGMYMFTGNPAAPAVSNLGVFDYDSPVQNSATNQVFGGAAAGVTNSQRGFRFSPNEDVLLIQFGKNEPNGTTRTITLFDNATQTILAQMDVAGPAGQYTYVTLPQPMWLTQGTQYLLEMYQGAADGYYFGSSAQINPRLTYYDMRYCNGCDANTFPQNYLSAMHYGYPDLEFMTRKQASPAASYAFGPGPTSVALASDNTASIVGAPVTFTATVNGVFLPTGNVAFSDGGVPIPGCESVALDSAPSPTATCVTSNLGVGSHDIEASYGGDVDDSASISSTVVQVVDRAATATLLGSGCQTTFVEHQPFTLNAGVAGNGIAPTGSVTFTDGANSLCGDVALASGAASCVIGNFAVVGNGTTTSYALMSNYSGDANNHPSASSTLMLTVLSSAEVVFRNAFEAIPTGCPLQ